MRAVTLTFLVLGLAASVAHAAPIVAGSATQQYINIQRIRLFPSIPGTFFNPFNPTAEAVEFDLIASGSLTATWEAQVGNTMQHAVPNVQFTGLFPGNPPIPFDLIVDSPGLLPTTGQFSNVVQNPNDPGFATGDPSSLVSADYMNTAYFTQVLPDGTTIYSDQDNPAVFTGTLTSLPYEVGQEFISTGGVDLYLQLGATIDQPNDLHIGRSLHAVVRVVPEPTSGTLAILGVLSLGLCRRRRRHTM